MNIKQKILQKPAKAAVSIGAILVLGTSMVIGTYAYFTANQKSHTNLTLLKGTVKLSDAKGDTWSYYGNQVDFSTIDFNATDYMDQTMINPDLSNDSNTIGTTPSKLFTGNSFSQVVPGDTFAKTVKVTYEGTNNAEVAIKFQSKRQDWSTLVNYYNLKVEYQINMVDKEGQGSPHKLIANDSNAATLAELISETGTKISETVKKGDTIQMNFYAQLKAKDYDVETAKNVVNFASVDDAFEIHVQNKLYPKTSTVNE